MNPITLAWMAEIGIITWRSVKGSSRPPIPSELLATFIAFGSLTLIGNSSQWQRPAGYMAGGLVLATLLNFFDPATGKPYVSASGGGGAKPASTGAPAVGGGDWTTGPSIANSPGIHHTGGQQI